MDTTRLTALFLMLSLGACQGFAEPEESKTTDAAHSPIHFQHADYDPDLAEYTVQRNTRSGNEFHIAKFYGVDAFAILAAYKTSPGYVVPERTTESYIARAMQDAPLDWGESGRTPSRLGQVPYRLFRVVDQPVSCVGFSQQVGETSDDLGRKSDLVFGFFCQDDSRPMSAGSAQDLISKVSLGLPGR